MGKKSGSRGSRGKRGNSQDNKVDVHRVSIHDNSIDEINSSEMMLMNMSAETVKEEPSKGERLVS